jgi:response regulator RpfG family c-di-GMP phosphodiesterase
MNPRILFVDDETNILAGYKRLLKQNYDITTAESGNEGLERIKDSGEFTVIVSDYKMPGMDGVKFLTLARQAAPDAIRIMLTGFADVQAAINAVNEGNIFRFLTKPCPMDTLTNVLTDAIAQYNLVMAERELLNNTLKGSIKLLIDILSAVNPIAFSKALRLNNLVTKIANRLKITDFWEIEIAALLSQIGCVTIPSSILERKYSDKPLTTEELGLYNSHSMKGRLFIKNIPRLENIANAIALQYECYNLDENNLRAKQLPLISRILKVANDYDMYIESGKSSAQALFQMHKDNRWYDPQILDALDSELAGIEKDYILKTLSIKDIEEGMVLAESIYDKNKIPLITKGNLITSVLISKLANLVTLKIIIEPFKILVPLAKIKKQ